MPPPAIHSPPPRTRTSTPRASTRATAASRHRAVCQDAPEIDAALRIADFVAHLPQPAETGLARRCTPSLAFEHRLIMHLFQCAEQGALILAILLS